FSLPDRSFVVGNAQAEDCSVIFVNEGFCTMSGFARADVMQKSCLCPFLHGDLTSESAVQQLQDALTHTQEAAVELLYYKKDGQ
ncbi:PAS domain, partial [Trinorchestia longiramus]